MKFRKEDRAEFARNLYVALLVRGELPADGADASATSELLRQHMERFETALGGLKQPDLMIPEDSVAARQKRRLSHRS